MLTICPVFISFFWFWNNADGSLWVTDLICLKLDRNAYNLVLSSSNFRADMIDGMQTHYENTTGTARGGGGACIVSPEAKRAANKWMKKAHVVKASEQKHTYHDQVEFAKAEQFGARAVGGHRPHDEKLYGLIQSSDYLTPDTKHEEAMQHSLTPAMRKQRKVFMWAMYAVIGCITAVVIVYVLHACDLILKLRAKATDSMLDQGDLLSAWLIWTGSSLGLCLAACMLVMWQPAAVSSGIPGLIAFLNGVMPVGGKSPLTHQKTGFLSFSTLVAKTLGMILSIPSGLCLGPEGPIIHISALIAHHTTTAVQRLSQRVLNERFHFTVKPGEGRDFLATGAAVGICVAFRAPLAGCLFVVEEAASFFTTEHLEYTFFATIVAYMVALALAQPEDGFTKFKQATGYFCPLYDGFDMILFVVIAVLGGTSGALFNHIVERLNDWRATPVSGVNANAWKRVTELVVLVLVTGTVAVFLPHVYACEMPTRELLMRDSVGCCE